MLSTVHMRKKNVIVRSNPAYDYFGNVLSTSMITLLFGPMYSSARQLLRKDEYEYRVRLLQETDIPTDDPGNAVGPPVDVPAGPDKSAVYTRCGRAVRRRVKFQ